MALSGWCGQRGKPNCKGCRSALCACRCHGTNPAQNKGEARQIDTLSSVEFGTQSGPESTDIDRGLPITQAKDVTG